MDFKGSLLVIAIWALTTFSLLGIGVARITSSQLRLVGRFEERVASAALAHAAVRHAWALRQDDKTPYETAGELRTEQQQELGRGAFGYRLIDEESRIHLNRATQEILARVPGLNLDAAVAMTSSTLRPFHVKEELRLIEEITEPMYQQASPFLTVYGSGAVNINTAAPEVLRALGLEDRLVELIVAFRAGEDGEVGTADDGVFEEAGAIVKTLRSASPLFAAQEAVLIQLISQGLLGVRSTTFTLLVDTTLLGRPAQRYAIVLNAREDRIMQWLEP